MIPVPCSTNGELALSGTLGLDPIFAQTLLKNELGCSTVRTLRKILSILLLAVFALPLLSPLLAHGADRDAGLPACCRKNGKHHCMMSMGERNQFAQHGPAFGVLPEKCPYCPATIIAAPSHDLAVPTAEAIFAALVSHPSGVAQTESKCRISQDRSRQKRGPPTSLFL